jgi:hypothetical protein
LPVAAAISLASAAKRAATTVERFIAARPEHAREERRLDLAEREVGIGHRQRPAAAIARRPRVRAGALRADAKARAVEGEDRAAAGGDGVDRHHRRPHANAGDARLERALELASVVADVGRGAAHVEADDLDRLAVVAGDAELGRAHHADDAAGRAGQDRVLALERIRLREAARRLHEVELDAGHLGGDLVDVAAQDRRQVGVDDGRVAAADELHHRADAVRNAHLREAGRASDPFRSQLV